MKKLFFISMIAAAALLGGLTACNNELGEPQADQVPENAVRITASIYNPFAATRSMPTGTAEEQAKFNTGDEILVKVGSQQSVYRFDGTVWTPKDGKYLLWVDGQESFNAYYPTALGMATFPAPPYVHPTDQSSIEKIVKADLMTGALTQAKTKEALHFTMHRKTARLVVKIAGFKPEFPANAKVKNVKFINKTDPGSAYIPYAEGDGKTGSTYTVLVPAYAAYNTVSLTVDGKVMTAQLPTTGFKSGKSYTYRLTVGKEKLEPGEVTVADWSGSTVITGGEAQAD